MCIRRWYTLRYRVIRNWRSCQYRWFLPPYPEHWQTQHLARRLAALRAGLRYQQRWVAHARACCNQRARRTACTLLSTSASESVVSAVIVPAVPVAHVSSAWAAVSSGRRADFHLLKYARLQAVAVDSSAIVVLPTSACSANTRSIPPQQYQT